jgi:hypothetical protein
MILQERKLATLRLLSVCHLLAVAIQPVLAGQYLSGRPEALGIHAAIGETVAWLALTLALLALIYWRKGWLSRWTAGGFVLIFALDGLQLHMGYAKSLAVHIPLGTFILVLSFAMTAWLWRHAVSPTLRQ